MSADTIESLEALRDSLLEDADPAWQICERFLNFIEADRDALRARLEITDDHEMPGDRIDHLEFLLEGERKESQRLRAELAAMRAEGMPSDRDALQALLDGAYNKGRDDVHALYQTGAPIALLRAELARRDTINEREVWRWKQETSDAKAALAEALKDLNDADAELDRTKGEMEDMAHAIRFLAKQEARTFEIRGKAIQMLAKGQVEEAKDLVMMKWPIVQGLRNQIDLAAVGNQECDYKRVRPAIEALLSAALERKADA